MNKVYRCLLVFSCLSFVLTSYAIMPLGFDIDGLDGEKLDNTLILLKEERNKLPEDNTDLLGLYQRGPQLIQQAIQPFGYFHSTIHSDLRHYLHESVAYYTVTLGPPLIISHIDINITGPGKNNPQIQQFVQHFPLVEDQIFSTNSYEQARDLLYATIVEQGYINAKWTLKELSIDKAHNQAIVYFHITTGPRYYFANVTFYDNPMNNDFLKRYVQFKPGEVYSQKKLRELQENLSHTTYFNSVDVQPQTTKAKDEHVPVEVHLTPAPRHVFNIGAGYGTDTKIRSTLGWQWNRITRDGQYSNVNLSLSQLTQDVTAAYYIPGNNPITSRYTIHASLFSYNTDAGETFNQTYGAGYSNTVGHWTYHADLNLLIERYKANTDTQFNSANMLLPTFTLTYLSTDHPAQSNEGWMVRARLRGSAKALFSSTNFVQLLLKSQWIIPIGEHNRLLLRASAGGTTITDFNELPLSLRFTAGGVQDVRGYKFQSLGAEFGGGRYLLTSSIEVQHEIFDDWYLGVFYDAGNAFNTIKNTTPLLDSSVGISISWSTIVGNLSLSVAQPLVNRNNQSIVQFNLSTLL